MQIFDEKKIKWACRRGMLELDVLLGNYFEAVYQQLTADDKTKFIKLLHCADPDIFGWLLQSRVPEDEDIAYISQHILQHAKSHLHI